MKVVVDTNVLISAFVFSSNANQVAKTNQNRFEIVESAPNLGVILSDSEGSGHD